MNEPVASGERSNTADSRQWLPAHELSNREGNAVLRSWLTTPGLLTERVRAAIGAQFRLRVVGEFRAGQDHVRRIELGQDGEPWIYAETHVPAATLAAHSWLAGIGSRSLGEVLAEFPRRVRRSEFEFACMGGDSPLVARALAGRSPRALWVRRSTIRVDEHPFTLQEVFLPVVAERGTNDVSAPPSERSADPGR